MHVHGGHRQKPVDFQQRHYENGGLVAIMGFIFSLALNINPKLKWHNTYVYV